MLWSLWCRTALRPARDGAQEDVRQLREPQVPDPEAESRHKPCNDQVRAAEDVPEGEQTAFLNTVVRILGTSLLCIPAKEPSISALGSTLVLQLGIDLSSFLLTKL